MSISRSVTSLAALAIAGAACSVQVDPEATASDPIEVSTTSPTASEAGDPSGVQVIEPSSTPEAVPPAELFVAESFTGEGADAVDLAVPTDRPVIVTFTNAGAEGDGSWATVKSIYDSGDDDNTMFVFTLPEQEHVAPVGVKQGWSAPDGLLVGFDIEAEGDWHFTVTDISEASLPSLELGVTVGATGSRTLLLDAATIGAAKLTLEVTSEDSWLADDATLRAYGDNGGDLWETVSLDEGPGTFRLERDDTWVVYIDSGTTWTLTAV